MSISIDAFRDGLRHFAAGVTVVTIRARGETHGLTVSAFTSISADPPLVAVVIARRHYAHQLLDKEDAVFAVNILAADQEPISNRFAFTKDEDRFAVGSWKTAATGAPVLEDALAWLDCSIHARHDAGSHTIFVGHVEASAVPRADEAPLLYWNRDYRRVAESVSDEES